MTYTLTNFRDDFKLYVGDSSLTSTVCDTRLQKSYTRIRRLVFNTDARRELPITIARQTPVYDTVLLSYYITLPITAVAWRFPNNDQISQVKSGSNRLIYLARNRTSQIVEYLTNMTYPTTDGEIINDVLAEIVVLDAATHYLTIVARDIEMAGITKDMRREKLQELNQKYAQQFIYNENDGYEEVKVNLP